MGGGRRERSIGKGRSGEKGKGRGHSFILLIKLSNLDVLEIKKEE